MRVGLNLLFLLPGQLAGIATYARHLVTELARQDRENQYFLFVNAEAAGHFSAICAQRNFEEIVCPTRASFRPSRLLWEQFVLPLQLKRYQVDLVHSLGYFSPAVTPCPSVTTIADLNFVHAKDSFSAAGYLLWRVMVSASVKRSHRIVTISQSSKRDIVEFFGLNSERVQVTYLAASDTGTHSKEDCVDLSQYGIRTCPIVSVGSSHPHKNLARLVRAYKRLIDLQVIVPQLVLVGHRRADAGLLETMMRQLELGGRLVLTGYVPDKHLRALYSRAVLFVFPSLYEGFGIPVLEAMSHGIPTVCSELASLPEVAGDAALFFDPYDVKDIAAKMYQALTDSDLRQDLVRKGYRNARRFSWGETARQTIGIYYQVGET